MADDDRPYDPPEPPEPPASPPSPPSPPAPSFDELADRDEPGIVREFFDFLRDNRKWFLAPIVVVLLLVGLLLLLGATGAAPFIYTLW